MQERLSDTPKRTFLPPQKARLTETRHAEHYLTERNTHFKPPKQGDGSLKAGKWNVKSESSNVN